MPRTSWSGTGCAHSACPPRWWRARPGTSNRIRSMHGRRSPSCPMPPTCCADSSTADPAVAGRLAAAFRRCAGGRAHAGRHPSSCRAAGCCFSQRRPGAGRERDRGDDAHRRLHRARMRSLARPTLPDTATPLSTSSVRCMPPSPPAVRDAMPVFFDLLREEPEPSVSYRARALPVRLCSSLSGRQRTHRPVPDERDAGGGRLAVDRHPGRAARGIHGGSRSCERAPGDRPVRRFPRRAGGREGSGTGDRRLNETVRARAGGTVTATYRALESAGSSAGCKCRPGRHDSIRMVSPGVLERFDSTGAISDYFH